MVRAILGAIAGYAVFSLSLFVLFSVLYMVLGADGSFQPGNFDLTFAWIGSSLFVFFIGAVAAGLVCGLIARDKRSGLYMGLVIFVLGVVMAILQIAQDPGVTVRETAQVPLLDAMNKAHGPAWSYFINPIIGFAGAIIGGRIKKSS